MMFVNPTVDTEPAALEVLDLGQIDYHKCWKLQKNIQRDLIDRKGTAHLLLCEHNPVITLGKSAKKENVLACPDTLRERGIEVVEIERGGDVTYHGPGQLVIYPLIDLREKRRDVGWYMRLLEAVIIDSLGRFNIAGKRIEGRTGVWIENGRDTPPLPGEEKKIASIGIRLSRWCTLHGFSINLSDCHAGFDCIHPCGFEDIAITSVAEELDGLQGAMMPATNEIKAAVVDCFCTLFDYVRR